MPTGHSRDASATGAAHVHAVGRPSYRRREPSRTTLHGLVRQNLQACLALACKKSAHSYGYPRFVEREFEKFLNCGLLRRGFVRVRCTECQSEKLVAFSCKGRGVCPSCTARRMASTAAHLVERVLPKVPFRQWVISFPKRVRFALARDHDLLSDVLDHCLRKIFAWQRRRARALGVERALCGSVSFCQRFGSLLNLNCHFHSLLPDGVFVDRGGDVQFVPVPAPWPKDIERLTHQIAQVVEKRIERHMSAQISDEPPDVLKTEQARVIEATRFPRAAASDKPTSPSCKRSAFFFGYSLHAERYIDADDREGLERLCRYGARAPIANNRLWLNEHGDAVIELRRPLRDGRTHLTFSPIELLQRLAILIPPPKKNLTRYHGVFAPAHPLRGAIVPDAIRTQPAVCDASTRQPHTPQSKTSKPSSRFSWAQLLRRVFAVDVLQCDQCSAPMRIIAFIQDSQTAHQILDHLGLEMCNVQSTGPPTEVSTEPDL